MDLCSCHCPEISSIDPKKQIYLLLISQNNLWWRSFLERVSGLYSQKQNWNQTNPTTTTNLPPPQDPKGTLTEHAAMFPVHMNFHLPCRNTMELRFKHITPNWALVVRIPESLCNQNMASSLEMRQIMSWPISRKDVTKNLVYNHELS